MKKKMSVVLLKAAGLIVLIFCLLAFVDGKPLCAAEPIKIGAVLGVTGRAGFLGTPQKEAMTAVVEAVNRQGGILGRPIDLYIEDDQSNPTNSAVAAQKLIRDKKVCCLIGSSLVALTMPIIPICEAEEVPQITIAPVVIPFKKWVFCGNVTDVVLSEVILRFTVKTLGLKKIALLHSSDVYGMNGAKGIMDNIDKYGASLVIKENFDPADTSMVPQLTKVRAAKPDVIILYTTAPAAAVIAKNCQQLGIETPVVGSSGIPNEDFIKLAGNIVSGGRWILYGVKDLYWERISPDDPYRKNILDPLMKAIKEKYGKTEYNGMCRNAPDGLRIAMEGLKIAGTDNRAALRDALEKVRYDGFLGAFKYSPTDHNGGNSGEGIVPIIIKDGRYWPYAK